MEYLVLLGLLLLKHGVLAHVIDWGYSESRHPHNRVWQLHLLRQTLLEGLVTGCLLYWPFSRPEEVIAAVVVTEAFALITSCLVERRAPIRQMVEYHLVLELAVLLVYAMLAFIVVFTYA